MILLFSKDYAEMTTEEVMDWLEHDGAAYLRINGEALLQEECVSIRINKEQSCNTLIPDGTHIAWYRRGIQKGYFPERYHHPGPDIKTQNTVLHFLRNEHRILYDYTCRDERIKHWIDAPQLRSLNKLEVLQQAVSCGLTVPDSLVTTSKEALTLFVQQHEEVVVKPISEVATFTIDEQNFFFDTKSLCLDDIAALPEQFYPSLVQQRIQKRYEIRSYYLDGVFYSMAIFSQRRAEAQLDYRVYDFDDPDRMVPYQLDEAATRSLKMLAGVYGFQHCSMDCIIDTGGRLVFLEINPVGQYGMVSKPCNYCLERETARFIQNKHDEYTGRKESKPAASH